VSEWEREEIDDELKTLEHATSNDKRRPPFLDFNLGELTASLNFIRFGAVKMIDHHRDELEVVDFATAFGDMMNAVKGAVDEAGYDKKPMVETMDMVDPIYDKRNSRFFLEEHVEEEEEIKKPSPTKKSKSKQVKLTTFAVPKVFVNGVDNKGKKPHAAKKMKTKKGTGKKKTTVTNDDLPPPAIEDELFFFENEDSVVVIQNTRNKNEQPENREKKKKKVRSAWRSKRRTTRSEATTIIAKSFRRLKRRR